MPRKARHSEVLQEDHNAQYEEQPEPKGRKKRKNEQEHVEMIPVPDPEREQEAWDEFAADYYEIVEQLPLELHRNFALLRELDDQTQLHTANLLNQLRSYISLRLPPSLGPRPSSQSASPIKAAPHFHPIDTGIPQPDGQGGLVVSKPEITPEGSSLKSTTEPQSLGFPSRESKPSPSRHHPAASKAPHVLLPDVAKLSREMVRGAEEKVALAQGAYNTIDRHIRSLDSALMNSEAAQQLGMRPMTHPSTTVEPPVASTSTLPNADSDEITIGMGGGRARKKGKRKGRKGQVEEIIEVPVQGDGQMASAVAISGGLVPASFDLEVDPNEPRYCYCNNVSYGEMIGCENEECPLEWFHLACAGLQTAPTGKWWCNVCRPKVGKAAAHGRKK